MALQHLSKNCFSISELGSCNLTSTLKLFGLFWYILVLMPIFCLSRLLCFVVLTSLPYFYRESRMFLHLLLEDWNSHLPDSLLSLLVTWEDLSWVRHPALPVSLERITDISPTPFAVSGLIYPKAAFGFSSAAGCFGPVGTLVIAYPSFTCLVFIS